MFNYKKAVQIISWLLRKYKKGVARKLLLIKLIYFADKYHLRKYGRTVSGSEYIAMRYGPVATKVLNVADQKEEYLPLSASKLASETFTLESSGTFLRLIDITEATDSLSKTDIEALEFAFEKFGDIDAFKLAEITHHYPEWEKHKKELFSDENPNCKKSVPMDIRDFLADAPKGYEPCYSLSEEDKVFVLGLINDSEAIDNFFKIQ